MTTTIYAADNKPCKVETWQTFGQGWSASIKRNGQNVGHRGPFETRKQAQDAAAEFVAAYNGRNDN